MNKIVSINKKKLILIRKVLNILHISDRVIK